MIKTKALEKLAKFLKSKKISEVNFANVDNAGIFNIYNKGIRYELKIKHDSTEVRVEEKRVKYL